MAIVAPLLSTGTATAQYGGGGIEIFVDPVRVPIDQTFDVTGRGCAAGATVVITIDGVSGTLATTTATAGGFYAVDDVVLPDGLLAGTSQNVRATCETETATALITLVCPSGDDPVGGSCEDGSAGIVGGPGPTTTLPAGQSTNTSGSPIAFTGAAYATRLIQLGATLFGGGLLLAVAARRRRVETTSRYT